MTNEKLYEVIGDISDKHIKEAKQVRKEKQPIWLKWGAMAACLCLIVISIIGIITHNNKSYTVILSNGNQITFNKRDNSITNLDMAIVGIRDLDETEAREIFGEINIEAFVGFEEPTNDFISLEGTIDNFDIRVLRSDLSPDIVIDGDESTSDINGVSVSAGYFLTKANSHGIKTSIVYANFEVGNYTIYLETSGSEKERDALCNALAEEIQFLLENANLDFNKIN